MTKLKSLYEEEMAKVSAKSKGVQQEIKKHIEGRMNGLEQDYILRVVHEQKIKSLMQQTHGCSGCY